VTYIESDLSESCLNSFPEKLVCGKNTKPTAIANFQGHFLSCNPENNFMAEKISDFSSKKAERKALRKKYL